MVISLLHCSVLLGKYECASVWVCECVCAAHRVSFLHHHLSHPNAQANDWKRNSDKQATHKYPKQTNEKTPHTNTYTHTFRETLHRNRKMLVYAIDRAPTVQIQCNLFIYIRLRSFFFPICGRIAPKKRYASHFWIRSFTPRIDAHWLTDVYRIFGWVCFVRDNNLLKGTAHASQS